MRLLALRSAAQGCLTGGEVVVAIILKTGYSRSLYGTHIAFSSRSLEPQPLSITSEKTVLASMRIMAGFLVRANFADCCLRM